MPKRATAKSKKQPKPASAPAPEPTPSAERPRAAEDRLALRVAVLEDVVKRAHNELARRIGDVEKRLAAT